MTRIEILREEIKDGMMCQWCKERPAWEVHHIMHGADRKLSEQFGDACLIALCRKCHNEVHHVATADDKYNSLDWTLKRQAQEDFEFMYPEEDWMVVFGRNYLW